MKKIIVYFPFPLREMSSGSAVRPQKLLKAFKEYGLQHNIEIIKVYGETMERKKALKKIYKEINPKEILFCYIENASMPIWLTDNNHFPRTPFMDSVFLRYLNYNKIPVGLFYRDIYWKFKGEYPLKGYKRVIMQTLHKLELMLYKKHIDYFFLPSIKMNDYIDFPQKKVIDLPPAGEVIEINKNINKKINMIYVGGISERYGLTELLEGVSRFNEKNEAHLHLVCRKEEYLQKLDIFKQYESENWLNIYHAHGKQLKDIYLKADIGIIPIQKTIYNDFAVPVKLFEYMSYGLPQIVTNCEAQSAIIRKDKLGIIVKDSASGIVKGIEFFSEEKNREKYNVNVKKALLENHLWINRVEKISNILTKNKE